MKSVKKKIALVWGLENELMKESDLFIKGIRLDKQLPKGNYLNDLSVIKNLRKTGGVSFEKPITFLVGENGIGKSTLIEAIAVQCRFNAE
jgi:predicted ATPase